MSDAETVHHKNYVPLWEESRKVLSSETKVFREIGLADELGSGMKNTYKYTKMYSGDEPQFVEGDVFRITIPLSEVATATIGTDVITPINGVINGAITGAINLSETEKRVLQFFKENPRSTKPIVASSVGIGAGTVERAIKKLKDLKLLERVGSNKAGYWKVNCRVKQATRYENS